MEEVVNSLVLESVGNKLKGIVELSGSKSISNRVLLMKNLAGSPVIFERLSNSDDTNRIKFYLKFIDTCLSSGVPMIVDTKNAGTVMRFLTAYLAIREGKWMMVGTERMYERPIGQLVESLNALGARITYARTSGFPPILINGGKMHGGSVELNPRQSSQFVSALMMIGPYLKDGLKIVMEKNPVSTPYIIMTAKLMQKFGVEVKVEPKRITVSPGDYNISDFEVEADWSSAAYWYQLVALSDGGEVFLPGLKENSLQGDSVLAKIFNQLGVETVFVEDGIKLTHKAETVSDLDFNFKDCPDLAPSVMACCAIKGIELKMRGITHLKFKESDRLSSMDKELSKIGCELERQGQAYFLKPATSLGEVVFNTHDDHRIALSLATLALRLKKVTINNPEVIIKSYPEFWKDIERMKILKMDGGEE